MSRYNLLNKIARKHKINPKKIKNTEYKTKDVVKARSEYIHSMRFKLGIKPKDIAKYLKVKIGVVYKARVSIKQLKRENLILVLKEQEAELKEVIKNIRDLVKIYEKQV